MPIRRLYVTPKMLCRHVGSTIADVGFHFVLPDLPAKIHPEFFIEYCPVMPFSVVDILQYYAYYKNTRHANCQAGKDGRSVISQPHAARYTLVIFKENMFNYDEAKKYLIAYLSRDIEHHISGAIWTVGDNFDEFDNNLPRNEDPKFKKIHIGFNFWDGWQDARNHDWRFYKGIGENDWPQLAKLIIEDIQNEREITSDIILRHFDLKPRTGLFKKLVFFLKPKSSIVILGFFLISLPGCFSNHLQVDTLTQHYAVLSYDHGAMIPQVDESMRVQKIKEVCPSGNYEIIEKETKTVGQYHFRTKILFKCHLSSEQ